ncbi:unnamed protein product, partial [Musa textilis]
GDVTWQSPKQVTWAARQRPLGSRDGCMRPVLETTRGRRIFAVPTSRVAARCPFPSGCSMFIPSDGSVLPE